MPAAADDAPIRRCADLRLDQSVAQGVGYTLKKTKLHDIDIGNGPVIVQSEMAGMKGPSLTLLGRDVRLAVVYNQTSPQELWQKGEWNRDRIDECGAGDLNWMKRFKRDLYWNARLDVDGGFTTYQPKILYRTRVVVEGLLLRPHGFALGAALSTPALTNTDALLYQDDTRAPVRRDMERFSNTFAPERIYASWRTSPITDVYLSISGGYLEEMYAGAGAEAVWRPFGSPFWFGADGWRVRRRDSYSAFNLSLDDDASFTGHVRAGYDIPYTRATLALEAGTYLAGDHGATLSYRQDFESGLAFEAGLTWTDRKEAEGFISDTHFDGMARVVWPLGGHKQARITLRQMGRDGGAMLDRPLPLERMTETFSAREVIRHWPQMFD